MKKLLSILFQIVLVITIFLTGNRVFAANNVEVTNVELFEKSAGVEVNSTSYSDSTLTTDPIFHDLNDYVTYKITVKNNDSIKHDILGVADDNNSKYITTSYTHEDNIEANGTSEILMTVKLTKLVDDASVLNGEDIYSLGEINITLSLDDGNVVINTNPKTGDIIFRYVAILLASIITLVLALRKKITKKSVMAILIATLFISTNVIASSMINIQLRIHQDSIQVKVDTYNIIDKDGNEYKYIANVDQSLGITATDINGYELVGFSSTENGTVEYQNGDTINREDDLVLYPVYELITYEITYDLAGGNVSPENPTSYTVEENVTLTNPTKEYYTFDGWTGTELSGATDLVVIPTGSTGNRSYKANWTPINYTITYNLDGGSSTNPESYNYESGNITLSEPTKEGYTFTGWTGTGLTSPTKNVVIVSTDSPSNRTYTANWTPTVYTITYNLNGGTVEAANPTTYTIEENATLTNPTKEYYTFDGWTGTGLDSTTDLVVIPTGSTGNRTYTANWTPIDYTITYDLDGGSATNPESYNYESGNMTLSEPTKEGYTFTGWTGTGLTEPTKNVVIVSTDSPSNRTYTANWTLINYSISYILAGGTATNPTSYTIEDSITLTNPTKNYYTFSGWTGTDLTGLTNSVVIPTGSTGNRSYTANWTPINYTILYTLNGGSATNPSSYNYESGNMTLSEPTRYGYEFTGWTGTGLTQPTKNVVIVSTDSPCDRSYTANWAPINYTITYDLDGGSLLGTNPGNYNIETNNFTLMNPEREGYTFAGWTGTDIDSPRMNVTINKGSTGNRSYKATWTPVNYLIVYNLNGGEVTNPSTYNVESDDITLNNPTKLGYEFKGWTGTGLTGLTTSVTVPTGSTGNRVYSANWTPIDYEIEYEETYNSVYNPTSYTIESSDIRLNYPSRYGYRFMGWTGTDLEQTTMDVTISRGSVGDRTYTAMLALKEYTVTYIDGDTNSTEQVFHGFEAPVKQESGKTGYTFKWWSLTENGGAYDFSTPVINEMTLFAVYQPINYTITYNLDGGSTLTPNPTSYNIESIDITLMNPTKPKYIFVGWTGTDLDTPTETVVISNGSIGDRTYTANYVINNHTVVYNDNGSTTNEYVVDGNTAPEKAAAGKIGYTFKYWSLSSNGEAYDFSTPVNDNLVLYAVYDPIVYTITYNLDGGNVATANPSSYTIESNNITLNNPTKEGYTFTGWTGTDLDAPTENVVISTGSIGNRSYTATYALNEYTVTYNDQGVLETVEVNHGGHVSTRPASGKTGYVFAHWSLSSEGGEFDFNTPITSDTMLFAVYVPINYTITYDLGGGDVVTENPTSYNIESDSITLNNPVLQGHTFIGWTGTGLDEITEIVTIPSGSMGNRSYTAHYD